MIRSSPQAPLRLALAVALGAASFVVAAQDADQSAAIQAETAEAEAAMLAEVDPRCLRHTGSRVTADPVAETAEGAVDAEGQPRCANAPGSVYTKEELDRTGRTTVKEALQALDPRIR